MPDLVDRQTSRQQQPFAALARDDQLAVEQKPGQGPRILVVEDDFLVASEIEVALQSAGFAVTGVAASADEAIALAQNNKPDLAIIDIRLHGKRDGVDAALVLFREHAIPCIFATAHADEAVRARAAAASPRGWLQKPYTMPLLIEVVRRALAQTHS
jgi:DNA-binding NarL/FixJ family response regulator